MTRRRIPRNTAVVLNAAILADGEIAHDLTNKTLRLGDGATPGGLVVQASIDFTKRTVYSGEGAWSGRHGELNAFKGYRAGAALKAGTGGTTRSTGIVGFGANVLADGVGGFNDDFAAAIGDEAMRFARAGYCAAGVGLRFAYIVETGQYFSGIGPDNFLNATHLNDAHALGVKNALGRTSVITSILGGGGAAQGGGTLLNMIALGTSSFDNYGSMAANNLAGHIGIGRFVCRGLQAASARILAIGDFAGTNGTNLITGGYHTLYGHGSGTDLTSATGAMHFGDGSGIGNTTANYQMTFGLNATAANYTNSVAMGPLSIATADNQFRFGPGVTPTADNALSVVSDARDKADIEDNVLGLDFLMQMRIVSYVRDFRHLYFETQDEEYEEEESYTDIEPTGDFVTNKEGQLRPLFKEVEKTRTVIKTRPIKVALPLDGRFKGKRRHLGVIAQEVEALCKSMGIDFAAVQHHMVSGGDDVYSFLYEQMILVNSTAIQELHAKHIAVANDLGSRLAVLEKKAA